MKLFFGGTRHCTGRPTFTSRPRISIADGSNPRWSPASHINGKAPYREVLTHAFVVDVESRQKISKSQQGGYAKPTEADHYVNKYGADIVRLWVSSVNYADEVPFGEKMFDQLTDTYRRIRNTLRILLANLYDFNPATGQGDGSHLGRSMGGVAASAINPTVPGCLPAIRVSQSLPRDKPILCRRSQQSLRRYHKGPDVLRRPASPRRRATQTVMYEIFETLVRLIAPILVFSAEEAWGYFGRSTPCIWKSSRSTITRKPIPAPSKTWRLFSPHAPIVAQSIEIARQQKLIGNALEAHVELSLPRETSSPSIESQRYRRILDPQPSRSGSNRRRTERCCQQNIALRCDRCWRHLPTVGTQAGHPTLCDRCAEVVSELAINE